ncbi:MAG: replication/repair protein RecF [Bacilli bacterium]|nr:replication/repair protein RecF [Bacilli bacterium]
MNLQKISLVNFRNYDHLQLEFSTNVNMIVGPNAQGKTNLLEAISLFATSKSYRTSKDQELIKWQSDAAILQAKVNHQSRELELELKILSKGKRAKVNGIDRKKMTDFVGNFNVVLFAPEDLSLIKGGPAQRRRFLDMEISQISPTYLHDLNQYSKIVLQRNSILREMSEKSQVNWDLLSVWDEQLIEHGVRIIQKRKQFLLKLQEYASDIHLRISNGLESLQLGYTCSIHPEMDEQAGSKDLMASFQRELERCKRQDLARGITTAGPHRDDVSVFINGYDVTRFASQGQQRTSALAMKLAEIELIKTEVGEYPVLLLDDVLSELDSSRQIQLLRSMGERVQTFITTTSTYGLETFIDTATQLFTVESGIITERR